VSDKLEVHGERVSLIGELSRRVKFEKTNVKCNHSLVGKAFSFETPTSNSSMVLTYATSKTSRTNVNMKEEVRATNITRPKKTDFGK